MQMGKIAKHSLCYQCLHLNIQHASIIAMHVTHGVQFSYLGFEQELIKETTFENDQSFGPLTVT